jgi:hypothetical protein
LGMEIDARLLHPKKPETLICVTVSGIVADVKLVHRAKALLPMLVTEVGISTVKRLEHC